MTPETQIIEQEFRSSEPDTYTRVGVPGILAGAKKALNLSRGLIEPDSRDSLRFKRILMTHNLIGERIQRDSGRVLRDLLRHVSQRRNLSPMTPGALTPWTEGMIVSNPLSSAMEEINPSDIGSQLRRVTHMGPGGIASDDSITPDMQAVHPSIFGRISPIEGPESSRAGLDVRLAHGVKIGTNGQIYQKYQERDTGEFHWLAPEDMTHETVLLPD